MVDIESLRTVVATGLREYLGCPVIRSNQNAPTPDYPFVSYTITTPATENNGTYGEYEDGVSRKGVNTVWSITSNSTDNTESVTLANKAREWLECVGSVYLNDNGVVVQAVTAITNRDNVLTTDYEYRNGFDCFFWCYDTVELTGIETIESTVIGNKEIQQTSQEDIIAELNHKLDEANADLENIRNAMASKGVGVTADTPTSEYANLILQMSSDTDTYILVDEDGNEVVGVVVEEETIFDATENDIREGKVAATASGVTTGTKVIPVYHTSEGVKYIPVGAECAISLTIPELYDYTKLQVIVCLYNTSLTDSVSAEKVVIEDNIYDVGSTISVSTVEKNSDDKTINLGLVNDEDVPLILRYFTYKEIY